MHIINILKGIENLAVELLLWIIYIPKTIFKIIKDPYWVPGYVDAELEKADKFTNYMSPILLYLGTTVILFVLTDMIGSKKELDWLKEIQGPEGLLFLLLPLVLALIVELFRQGRFNRSAILRGLYIQCYYFSPLMLAFFALLMSDAFYLSAAANNESEITEIPVIPLVLFMLTFIWFLIVEIKIIAKDLPCKKRKAFWIVILWFLLMISTGLFYTVITITTVDKTTSGEEVLTLDIPETGIYSIHIYPGNSYAVSLTQLNDSTDNKMGEAYSIREQVNPAEKNSAPIFLSYGQMYLGQHYRNGVIRQHTFRGSKDQYVSLYLSHPVFDRTTSGNSSLVIYPYQNNVDLSRFKYNRKSDTTAILNISQEDISDNEFLDTLNNIRYRERVVDFVLPRSGRFSFYLDFIQAEEDFNYTLGLARFVTQGTETYDTEYYYESDGMLSYGENYEGSFDYNTWKFKGKKGDHLELMVRPLDPLDDTTDISFDVQNADGNSVVPIDNKYITTPIQWLYVLLFGTAVAIGFRAFFRKQKKVEPGSESTIN